MIRPALPQKRCSPYVGHGMVKSELGLHSKRQEMAGFYPKAAGKLSATSGNGPSSTNTDLGPAPFALVSIHK